MSSNLTGRLPKQVSIDFDGFLEAKKKLEFFLLTLKQQQQ
jgi:hypothetical protein